MRLAIVLKFTTQSYNNKHLGDKIIFIVLMASQPKLNWKKTLFLNSRIAQVIKNAWRKETQKYYEDKERWQMTDANART